VQLFVQVVIVLSDAPLSFQYLHDDLQQLHIAAVECPLSLQACLELSGTSTALIPNGMNVTNAINITDATNFFCVFMFPLSFVLFHE
jgi:hypothetical protein